MKVDFTPDPNCSFCPRLAAFRLENRAKFANGFNAPVPAFGPLSARILIVGLAPGLKGANLTGRPFTGDWAGDLLYETLLKYNLASGQYLERADDGLELVNCRIANAVRCVPPQNRPEPTEIRSCQQFLEAELLRLAEVKVIVALGRIAHYAVCSVLRLKKSAHPFHHGGFYTAPFSRNLLARANAEDSQEPPQGQRIIIFVSSYHCSRYNTNTGVLTRKMFEDVIAQAKTLALGT